MNRTTIVIFIFTDGKKILVEKRYVEGFSESQYLIPGGTVKNGLENLEDALKRELMEELEIKPIRFNLMPTEEKIFGINNQLLIPFLIHSWEGNLPEIILDKGTPLTWIEIDEILKSPFKPTRKIAEAFKKHLLKKL